MVPGLGSQIKKNGYIRTVLVKCFIMSMLLDALLMH